MMMVEALECTEEGVRVGGELISDVRYADDQGMVASSEIGLQRLIDRLRNTATTIKKYSMKLHVKKDKKYGCLKKRRRNGHYCGRRTKSGTSQRFKYLRSLIAEDGRYI